MIGTFLEIARIEKNINNAVGPQLINALKDCSDVYVQYEDVSDEQVDAAKEYLRPIRTRSLISVSLTVFMFLFWLLTTSLKALEIEKKEEMPKKSETVQREGIRKDGEIEFV